MSIYKCSQLVKNCGVDNRYLVYCKAPHDDDDGDDDDNDDDDDDDVYFRVMAGLQDNRYNHTKSVVHTQL